MNKANPLIKAYVTNALKYVTEEMGISLVNAAYSPNITEREDRSTAIFDEKGRLITQAEHVPVHLGSLAIGFKRVLDYCKKESIEMAKNSMLIANNPYLTQSHLNDVIVLMPFFIEDELVGYLVNKAHHVDVGGSSPGSKSVSAKSIFEEGLLINPTYIVREGKVVQESLSFIKGNSRDPEEREGDLKAQIAANYTGALKLNSVITKVGIDQFRLIVDELIDDTKETVQKKIKELKKIKNEGAGEEQIELPDSKSAFILARIKFQDNRIIFDFSGTEDQLYLPYNAPYGVTIASVFYVMKSLFGGDLTVNDGFLDCFNVMAPSSSIVNASFPFPVAASNTIISQKIAVLLFRIFNDIIPGLVPAGASTSFNTVTFSGLKQDGKQFVYTETNGAGRGAMRGLNGISGIQIYMTNTKNTPIEDIEIRYPILVEQYELRDSSGGKGRWRGGDGIVRKFRMLEDNVEILIHSDDVTSPPRGFSGGSDGAPTEIMIEENGKIHNVPSKYRTVLMKGDSVTLKTPGGGGYGEP